MVNKESQELDKMLDDIGFANEDTPAAERTRAVARIYALALLDSADWDMGDLQVVLEAYIDGYEAGQLAGQAKEKVVHARQKTLSQVPGNPGAGQRG